MKKKTLIAISVSLILGSLLLIGVVIAALTAKNGPEDVVAEHDSQVTEGTEYIEEIVTETIGEEPEDVEPEKKKIRLMMLGDNLMHVSVVNSGNQPDGTRNYDLLFEPVKDYLALADIKITNQETIFGGNHLGFTGYPLFNSPTEMGDSIARMGFNVVLQATNHSADQGINGIYHCLDFWKKYPDVLVTGIFEEVDEPNQDIGLLEIDGVTFAILNYTYSPNMSALPKSIQGHLGMLCDWDKDTGVIDMMTLHPDVLTDIQTAKQMADFVIVCPHWGTEYTFVPTETQERFAKQITEAGADLIIGTHPHVIQPIEWIRGDNGNKALCFYSLGNYVSTQYRPATMLEAMAWVTFEVDGDTIQISEEETGAIPMVYQYKIGHGFENVYFLDEYTTELAQSHGIHFHGDPGLSLEVLQKWADEVLGEWRLQYQDVLKECVTQDMWR